MSLITILQVRKLRLWDAMRFSWGHTLISTEPEGNPNFWHSALTAELIISLLFISGALIHFYHQWVMTQSHCSCASWSCNAKWAFSNSAEPHGWVQTQMPAGRGLWGAICPMQKIWYFHLCESYTDSGPAPAAVKGQQCIPAPSSTSRSRLMPSSSLAGVNSSYSLHSFRVGWLARTGWEERWWKTGIG